MAIPGALSQGAVHRAVSAYRKQQLDAGLRGADLKSSVHAYRQQATQDRKAAELEGLPPGTEAMVKHPKKFWYGVRHGQGPALQRLLKLGAVSKQLGYDQDREALDKYYKDKLPDAGNIDTREGETPTMTQYQKYVRDHLGEGLTPEEKAAYRGSETDALEGSYRQNLDNEESRMASAGIDPRSGIGAGRAAALGQARAQGKVGIERGLTEADLQRKRDFENEASGVSGLEENRRSYDVGASLGRLGQVEGGYRDMAGLGERKYEHDLGYAESQRQAQMSRDAMSRAAEKLKPTTFEQVAGGIHGFIGGLSGGGGGGGGGGV